VQEDTSVELVYVVDVWTSASIDIRTSASKAVTEQRDEIDVNVGHALPGARLSAGYRYSTEPDYEAHGGSVGLQMDLASKSALLDANVTASFDKVGRAGDPGFSRDTDLLTARLSFTQIIDPRTLVQGIYEVGTLEGYLASPYRFVGIGSEDGVCSEGILYCVPEESPESRTRHAVAVRGRRAIDDALSVGGGYRYYRDDWDLSSHTLRVEGSWLPAARTTLGLRYRFYTQSAASHYRKAYPELRDSGLYTRDKELSPLHAHGAMLRLEQRWDLDQGDSLRAMLSAGPTFYSYRDYALLDSITALDVTLAMVLEL